MKKISLILVLVLLMSMVIIPGTASAAPVTGTGTGLTARYYYTKDLSGSYIQRIDSCINFNWGYGSPDRTMLGDTFSVQWVGQIEPLYSEDYTFYTKSDDGVRLWLNGKLLIDNWTAHSAAEDNATISLKAGQKYDIKLQYFEATGSSLISLSWSSKSQAKAIIPQTQLYPNVTLVAGTSPFDYAIFSQENTTLNSSLIHYIAGSVHSNGGLTDNGYTVITDSLEITGNERNINGLHYYGNRIDGSAKLSFPNVPDSIASKLKIPTMPSGEKNFNDDNLIGPIYANGNINFNSDGLSVKGPIMAKNNINFNGSVNLTSNEDEVSLYSENGNITIDGYSEIHGIIYAPNGTVTFNSNESLYDTIKNLFHLKISVNRIYGKIIAKRVMINGRLAIFDRTSINNVSIISDDDTNNNAIPVKKDMKGNLIDTIKKVNIKLDASSNIDGMKIKLTSSRSIKLPATADIIDINTGKPVATANIDSSGIININSLPAGSYKVSFGVTLDKGVADGDKVTLESIAMYDNRGNEYEDKDYNQDLLVKTLSAQLSNPSGKNDFAAFKGWNTSLYVDFIINNENSDINDITIAAIDKDKIITKDIICKFVQFVNVDTGKVIDLKGKTFPTGLSKGTYRATVNTEFLSSIPSNSEWSIFIKNINISDGQVKNMNFGPYDGQGNTLTATVIEPPKLH